jgi:hypothetical protein
MVILLGVYTLANMILCFSSMVAGGKIKRQAEDGKCAIDGIECGMTVWFIYSVQSAMSSLTATTAASMFTMGMSTIQGSNSPLTPLYVFRGVFATLVVLAPIIFVGWSSLDHLPPRGLGQPFDDAMVPGPTLGAFRPQFVGMRGAFILQFLPGIPDAVFPLIMVHLTV